MNDTGLNYEEIQQACRACRSIRISTPQPYLREFLAFRLEEPAPGLAAKIRQLSGDQFARLCSTIKEYQDAPR